MRRKMERFVLLPFSIGCISESSVAVGIQRNATSKPTDPNSSPRSSEKDEMVLEESLKNSQRFTALAKPNIGVGFHRLYKGFKNFSQLFVYKEEMEEMEEMEVGCPTDVKHLTHIGCDATTISDDPNNPFIDWETLLASGLFSLPSSRSWTELELDHHLSNPNVLPHSI
ncbi:CRIB domain-containing protein RIC4 [Cucurbita moschata]|uniref:CRIB domain-containing protein RIC4 n=1 Tax=Cucurbita moschata TaxID=3662 RepID=A0A6J1F000_CUCMO|nr:CRIB domain-containing protein RIC4 [Cucurbita moschata]